MNHSVQIRRARPGDESGIHEAHMRSIREICIRDHGPEEIRGWGNRELGDRWIRSIRDHDVWVVESDSVIYGFGFIKNHLENEQPQSHIYGLYLTPEVVGQKFGQRLMELMLESARQFGAKRVTLHSSITAHLFYQRFGFKDSAPMIKREINGFPVTSYPMSLEF